MGAKGCADDTRQMAAPLAPVETWTAQPATRLPPTPLPHARNVDPDPFEKCQAAPGENARLGRELGIPRRGQCVGQANAKTTGEMIVTGPRLPQRRIARANRKVLAGRLKFGRDRQ